MARFVFYIIEGSFDKRALSNNEELCFNKNSNVRSRNSLDVLLSSANGPRLS